MAFKLEPVATLQQKRGEGVLAGLERDLERGLRSRALGDRVARKLKRLPLAEPALDIVEAPLAGTLPDGQSRSHSRNWLPGRHQDFQT